MADVGVYYFSTAINQAVPFLLLPVITIYLSPRDFGYVNSFSALLLLAASAFNGLSVAINRNHYRSSAEFNRLLMGNLYLALLMGTFLVILAFLILAFIIRVRFLPGPYLLAIPIIVFFTISLEFLKNVLKISKQASAYASVTFAEVVVNVALSLVLIIGFSWHWQGRVWGIMLSTAIFGLLAAVYLGVHKRISFSFDKSVFQEVLRVALPFIPIGLGVMIMRRSGVLFVDSYIGKAEAGLYGVAMNLATIVLFLAIPLINTWTPFIYEKLSLCGTGRPPRLLYARLLLLCLGMVFLGFLLSVFSSPLLKLMTAPSFFPAAKFIPWMAFGFCLAVMTSLAMPFLVHFDRQAAIAWILSANALLNIGMNIVLIRRFGAPGAAASFLIANLLSVLLILRQVSRSVGMPFFPGFRSLMLEAGVVFKRALNDKR